MYIIYHTVYKIFTLLSTNCTLLGLNYLTAASWSNRWLAPLQKWMEWTAGREPYFMHLSEHIAIKGVESLSNGAGEGCGSSLPSHLYPPGLKQSCLCQAQLLIYSRCTYRVVIVSKGLGEMDEWKAHSYALSVENEPSDKESQQKHLSIRLSLHMISACKVHSLTSQIFGLKLYLTLSRVYASGQVA